MIEGVEKLGANLQVCAFPQSSNRRPFCDRGIPIELDGSEARRLADQLGGAWVAFAKTGNPNNPALPGWPAYDTEGRATMVFDTNTRVENDPLREFRLLWEEIGGGGRLG